VWISGLIEKKDPFPGKCQKISEGRKCDVVTDIEEIVSK
jgi:hypothetical protein